MQTKTIDRRAVVTGALAASTAVAASAIVTPQAASADADAALLELGRRFDELLPGWDGIEEKARDLSDEAHTLAFRQTGVWPGQRQITPQEGDLFQKNLWAAFAETGADKATEECDQLGKALEALADRIMELPATTPQGLATKARVLRYARNDLWTCDWPALDWEEKIIRQVVEAVEALAGRAAHA